MNKVLTIGNVYKEIAGDKVIFSSQIDFGNQTQTLWYRLDAEYSDYFCDDRGDGLAASLLFFSLMNGADIVSTLPISEKLYYQLTYHLIPQLYRCNKSVISPIKIEAPLVSTGYPKASGVGCGISCGVDSFTTLYEYTRLVPLDSFKLTHLTYLKVGAHDGQIGKYDKEVQECTAPDFLDTVIAVFDPTSGSRRSAIARPRAIGGVACSRARVGSSRITPPPLS